jgi:hypothetical protein
MNISLKPGPIIAIWLPGFALTMFIVLSLSQWDLVGLVGEVQSKSGGSFWIMLAVIAIAFVVGQFLDAARDVILENLIFDRICGKVRWEFFFEGNKEKLQNLEEFFYRWYEMDANIVVAILLSAILGVFGLIHINILVGILMAFSLIFFFWDAKELRCATKEMIDRYYNNESRDS